MPIKIFFMYEDETSDVLESKTEIVSYTTIVTSLSKQLHIINNTPETPILEPYIRKENPKYIEIEINGVKVYTSKSLKINTVTYYNEFNAGMQALREYIDITYFI